MCKNKEKREKRMMESAYEINKTRCKPRSVLQFDYALLGQESNRWRG